MQDPNVAISPDQLDDSEVELEAVGNRKSMRIVGNDTKQLRRKAVKLVKVQWGENGKRLYLGNRGGYKEEVSRTLCLVRFW